MKRKYKVLMILLFLVIGLFVSSITYSFFNSGSTMNTTDQKIAKFIFNAKQLDNINLPLVDLKPGDNSEYLFSVSNNSDDKISNVTINYQITIKTFHFIPFLIQLYKTNGDSDQLVLTCDETHTRNAENELVCNSDIQELNFLTKEEDNYKLKVSFPSEYKGKEYADLVDYIDIRIRSFQKTEK